MNRQNFDKKTRVEIIKRAGSRCEFSTKAGLRCGAMKGLEVHHTAQDALVGDAEKAKRKLTAEDGQLLCRDHHKEESAMQAADLAKAIRVEARDLGADKPKRGFAKVSKEKPEMRVAAGKSEIARRYGL
jgi:hypothetical protein